MRFKSQNMRLPSQGIYNPLLSIIRIFNSKQIISGLKILIIRIFGLQIRIDETFGLTTSGQRS